MDAVVRIDFELRWSMPVYVLSDDGTEQPIFGPHDALRYLREYSAQGPTGTYQLAIDACERCMNREIDRALARAVFVVAYTNFAMLRM
ncbi:DUF982 domain-containing protein [Rhizobiales bacterium RZME27]|jgi:hypothetical protein|uniref:DUF982 domain-containing protein n=1 Tax=Endobacterium cereale TaxID=2663029 RepID=A0A6A8AEP3_9HYPH|nr:DUF982 domain-containing protein [Endobacterium cereale]MEB2842949.1 DUF982 domain-containing protein [Endobacterium cereale]MQY49795.1 DUF982 domain-containing protein [Endobacterium cereale]